MFHLDSLLEVNQFVLQGQFSPQTLVGTSKGGVYAGGVQSGAETKGRGGDRRGRGLPEGRERRFLGLNLITSDRQADTDFCSSVFSPKWNLAVYVQPERTGNFPGTEVQQLLGSIL